MSRPSMLYWSRFNRNILGCKVDTVLNTLLCAADLIETYWDVKYNQPEQHCLSLFDLIETYWDVKKVNDLVLVVAQRFNRNILGYKLQNIKNEGKNMYGRKNNRNNDLLLFCLQA